MPVVCNIYPDVRHRRPDDYGTRAAIHAWCAARSKGDTEITRTCFVDDANVRGVKRERKIAGTMLFSPRVAFQFFPAVFPSSARHTPHAGRALLAQGAIRNPRLFSFKTKVFSSSSLPSLPRSSVFTENTRRRVLDRAQRAHGCCCCHHSAQIIDPSVHSSIRHERADPPRRRRGRGGGGGRR